MRIKKVSQTTSTQAQVVDGYSTSTTDSYSCNYANGLNGTILWTNPNPTSDFSAQSITLSSDDYDCYEVIANWASSVNRTQSSGKVLKGTGTVFNFVSSVSYYRTLTYVSDTEISVSNGTIYNITGGSSSIGNDWFIPLYVIGYKTGLFD